MESPCECGIELPISISMEWVNSVSRRYKIRFSLAFFVVLFLMNVIPAVIASNNTSIRVIYGSHLTNVHCAF